jgi:serine/threonine protein kinase
MGQEIGRGGFGTVFQALNTNTGDFVAVKRVALHDIDNDSLASIKVHHCCNAVLLLVGVHNLN